MKTKIGRFEALELAVTELAVTAEKVFGCRKRKNF